MTVGHFCTEGMMQGIMPAHGIVEVSIDTANMANKEFIMAFKQVV